MRMKPLRLEMKMASLLGVAPLLMPARPSGHNPTLTRRSRLLNVVASARASSLVMRWSVPQALP